jgi:hypothetical protein
MEHLLSHTMTLIDKTQELDPEKAKAELLNFPKDCRLQIFNAGNSETANFLVRQYQFALEFCLSNYNQEYHPALKMHIENALWWIYMTHTQYCDLDHVPPPFFVERLSGEYDLSESTKTIIRSFKDQPIKLRQIMHLLQRGEPIEEPVEIINAPKLELSLTVAQLGVLLNLFYEQQLFTNYNKIEVIKFFAAHFVTGKQRNISYESLYGKFFKMEPGDMEVVKEKLIQMINALNKHAKNI